MTSSLKRLAASVFAVALVTLAWAAAPASAYWSATGAGSSTRSTTDTLDPAVIDGPASSTSSVTISWSAEAGLDDPTLGTVTYVVQRATGAGAFATISSGACSGTFTRPATGSTGPCTDTVSTTGTYTYRVIATLATWTAISNAVTVNVNTDTTVPTVTSLNRYSPSTTASNSTTTVQFRAVFSETVKGVDATDFALVTTGAVSGTSIASVSPAVTSSATTFTITVNVGTGEGTLGINLVDNDSITDGANNKLGGNGTNNGNVTGQVYTMDRTAPVMQSIAMYDATTVNGKIDQVKVVYNETLSSSSLKTNWTINNCPSGCSLSSVSVSSKTVTLKFTEGSGTADTAVNSFSLALAAVATTGIRDVANNPASFAATAPADLAKPQLLSVTDTDGATDGLIETGDTMRFTFSEAINASTVPASPAITELRGSTGNATLNIASVFSAATSMQTTGYLNAASRTAVFAGSTAVSGAAVTTTVGTCSSGCTYVTAPATAPSTAMSIKPYTSIADTAGNTAGTVAATFATKVF